jgi:hypothetical protein
MRVYLDIPFAELNEAKSLGVKFDIDRRMWFVQDHESMTAYHNNDIDHPFIQLFGKWFANKMKRPTYKKFKNRHHVITQPRTPRKKKHKR